MTSDRAYCCSGCYLDFIRYTEQSEQYTSKLLNNAEQSWIGGRLPINPDAGCAKCWASLGFPSSLATKGYQIPLSGIETYEEERQSIVSYIATQWLMCPVTDVGVVLELWLTRRLRTFYRTFVSC
jgi:hypothetical protein